MANCFELAAIFEGIVTATGDHAFYPSRIGIFIPTASAPPPVQSISREQSSGDSQLSDTSSLSSPLRVSNTPIPKGRNRILVPSLTDKMSAALDIILQPEPESKPRGSSSSVSIVTCAVRKLQEDYKSKNGWTMEDLMLAYEMFENPVKAEIFLAIINPEEQDLWLRRQLDRFQSTL